MRSLFVVVSVVVGAACATTNPAPVTKAAAAEAPPPASAIPTAGPPRLSPELKAQFEREQPVVGQQTFTFDGKSFTVEGSAPVKVEPASDGLRGRFVTSVGATSPMSCMLHSELIDAGAAVWNVVSSVKKSLQVLGVRTTNVTVVEKTPAVFFELVYLLERGGMKQVGQLKLMAYPHLNASMTCMFDEPGYVKTFERQASTFAGAFARAYVGDKRYVYRSVEITRINGAPVGFSTTSWVRQADGELLQLDISAMVAARSATDVLVQDTAGAAWAARDGSLRKKTRTSISNGAIEHDLTLEQRKGGTYTYSGEVKGKALSGELTTSDTKPLLSDFAQTKKLKAELLSGKVADVVLEDYSTSVNPAGLTRLTFTRQSTGPRDVLLAFGGLDFKLTLDASGRMERMSTEAGPVKMSSERAYVEGSAE